DHGLDRAPDAGEVDVGDVPPLLLGQLPGHAHAGDAGIGADDVEVAELGQALLHRRRHLGRVPHVGHAGHDAPVEVLDQLDRLGEVVGGAHRERHRVDVVTDVDGDDLGALL